MTNVFRTLPVGGVLGMMCAAVAHAALYPVSPPGSAVELPAAAFLQAVPEQSAGVPDNGLVLPVPNPVIGDHLGQHPGGFVTGTPTVGAYFVGVFGGNVDTGRSDGAVYLWETSARGGGGGSFAGPTIELGWWSGSAFFALHDFFPFGSPWTVAYAATGRGADDPALEIYSAVVSLTDMGIPQDFVPPAGTALNAVRVTAGGFAHDQVTAIAATLVPEPGSLLLLATAVAALGASCTAARQRRKGLPTIPG